MIIIPFEDCTLSEKQSMDGTVLDSVGHLNGQTGHFNNLKCLKNIFIAKKDLVMYFIIFVVKYCFILSVR